MRKRILAMILAVVMTVSMLPTWALAEEGGEVAEAPATAEVVEAEAVPEDTAAEEPAAEPEEPEAAEPADETGENATGEMTEEFSDVPEEGGLSEEAEAPSDPEQTEPAGEQEGPKDTPESETGESADAQEETPETEGESETTSEEVEIQGVDDAEEELADKEEGAITTMSLGDGVDINYITFPDPTFREFVSGYDKNKDEYLSADELRVVTQMDISGKQIGGGLRGIENFIYLRELDCSDNNLTALSVVFNTALTTLKCQKNQISQLDLSDNKELKELNCASNCLSTLDTSVNTKLRRIYCYSNKLTDLKVSASVEDLSCSSNQLTYLDLSHADQLMSLGCGENRFLSLDLSNCSNLQSVSCYRNERKWSLNLSNTNITSFDCSGDRYQGIVDNLAELNVSGCVNLERLDLYDASLTTLNAKGCTALEELICRDNKLTSLDLSMNRALRKLTCQGNLFTELYLGDCPRLARICNNKYKAMSMDNSTYVYNDLNEHQYDNDYAYLIIDKKVKVLTANVVYFTISFDANGGTGAPASQSKAKGKTLTLSGAVPRRDGFYFAGWATSSSAAAAEYQPGGAFKTDADITLYAVWIPLRDVETREVDLNTAVLDREYLLLEMGSSPEMPLRIQNIDMSFISAVQWNSGDASIAVVDQSGNVTAKGAGTTYVTATLTDNHGNTRTIRCRVDVLDRTAQGGKEITASLPVNQVVSELYRTDYTQFDVVLSLQQNIIGLASVTTADGSELEDTGVTIKTAAFTGSADPRQDIRQVFGLRVADDRTLEIIPTIDLDDTTAVKAVASSYKSEILLKLSDGSEVKTPALTVKVGKTLPKLQAEAIKLNRFIDGDTAAITITGGKVKAFTADTLDFATLNDDLTVTLNSGLEKNVSGKYTLNCVLEDWAKPAPVVVTVSVTYTAPKLTFSPASLTLNPDVTDSATVTYKLVPLAGVSHDISGYRIYEGNETVDNGLLDLDLSEPGIATVSGAIGDEKAHTYKVYPLVDGKEVAAFTVKVLAKSKIALTAKAKGAIDTEVPNSPVTITVSGKNYNAAAGSYDVTIWQTEGKNEPVDVTWDGLFDIDYNANIITITCADAAELAKMVKGYTYSAEITANEVEADPVTVKFTVKTSTKKPDSSATLKASGSIDVLRPGTQVVLTPNFKNWYGYDLNDAELSLDPELFSYDVQDGVFIVKAQYGAAIDPKTVYNVEMTLDGYTTKPVKLPIKMGSVKIDQSAKTVNLLKDDRYDTATVKLSLTDDSLYDISGARVILVEKNDCLSLTSLGNGEYAIGYKNNTLPDQVLRGKIKGTSAKLNVYLTGNGGSAVNKTITVTVKFV